MRKLRELLTEYSLGLKYFRPDEEDDAALLYAVREELERKRDELTPDELQQLLEADNLARDLMAKYGESGGEGVFYLELLIKSFTLEPVRNVS